MLVAHPLNLSARMKPAEIAREHVADASSGQRLESQPFMAARPLIRAVCAKLLRLPLHDSEVEDCVAETLNGRSRARHGSSRARRLARGSPALPNMWRSIEVDHGVANELARWTPTPTS